MSQIEELRRILSGDSTDRLDALQTRIESVEARTNDVAEVLVPAINLGMKDDSYLTDALKRPVSEGLQQTIRDQPQVFAEILYPAIAPSIRRAISQAISSLLATLNQTVASATSIDGIRTRIESIRTGLPFAELALRKSLLYRVDHVYLIDRESGLLISECQSGASETLDSDAVSAMFSAIQSFVQDSFSASEDDHLTDFKVGSHTVWVAHGPKVMLACVILGNAPQSLREQLYDTLDMIRTHYANPIAYFNGDNSEFVGVQNYLAPLMQVEIKDEAKRKRKKLSPVTKIIYSLTALFLFYILYLAIDRAAKLETVKTHLQNVPGLVTTETAWQGGKIVVKGLLDPAAELPTSLLDAYGLDADVLTFETVPFISLDPAIEGARIADQLGLKLGDEIVRTNQSLRLNVSRNYQWLIDNQASVDRLVGEGRLKIDRLRLSQDSQRRMSEKLSALTLPNETKTQMSAAINSNNWQTVNYETKLLIARHIAP